MNNMQNSNAGPSVPAIAGWWQRRTIKVNGTLNTPLSPKELGQLKMLRTHLGGWTFFVMNWVWDNWWRFSEAVKEKSGVETAPLKPHIGFLLRHSDTAVNLMHKVTESDAAFTDEAILFKHKVDQMMCDLLKKQAEYLKMLEEMEM